MYADGLARAHLIVDLDGTLYRGDAPIRWYAREIARSLGRADAAALSASVESYLDRSTTEPMLAGAVDGWSAVATLALDRYAVDPGAAAVAFLATRWALATGDCKVAVPPGFADFLAQLRPAVRVTLATNSPADGLAELLARLDVAAAFDEVISAAGKPAGLLRPIAEHGDPDRPWRTASIGDHWPNDIAPALAVGAIGFYVDRFDRSDGPAHARGATVEDLLSALRAWVDDAETFAHAGSAPPAPVAGR